MSRTRSRKMIAHIMPINQPADATLCRTGSEEGDNRRQYHVTRAGGVYPGSNSTHTETQGENKVITRCTETHKTMWLCVVRERQDFETSETRRQLI